MLAAHDAPPVGADDAHAGLALAGAEAQFGGGEQAVDDHVAAAHAVVHQLGGVALGADHEQRRHLALGDAARELDEHLPAVVEGAQRPPRRAVALDRIAEVDAARSTPVATGWAASAAAFWRRSAISWSCGYCQDTEAM